MSGLMGRDHMTCVYRVSRCRCRRSQQRCASQLHIFYYHLADVGLDMRHPFDDTDVVGTSDDEEMFPDPLNLLGNDTIREFVFVTCV